MEPINLIRWAAGSPSMVELEARCASLASFLKSDSSNLLSVVTLALEGEKLLKLSELKKLLHLLAPLVHEGATVHIFCESSATQKLLEFCGLQLVSELSEGRTPDL